MQNCIMIVEDDENDLLLIQRALIKARVSNGTRIARDGAEALLLLLDGPVPLPALPLLVLLDLKLPRVDGLEVVARLRSEARTRTLPIVILSSSSEQEDVIRGYRLGANSYVRKPIDFVQFQDTVGRLGLYWSVINCLPQLR
jgi:two-component system response regulator